MSTPTAAGEGGTRDEPVLLDGPRGRLVGMLHRPPVDDGRRPGVLFCNAFGEERKSSALTMARLARAAARAGFPALRFDYYGCGDSEGEFVEADVETRLADIRTAAGFLRERCGRADLCLLGLRLGGALAAAAAVEMAHCAGLVLIEPITDGERYLGGELKRRLVRRMMTGAGRGAGRRELQDKIESDSAVLDMDGFALRGAAYKQIARLGIRAGEVRCDGPVLVCQVHFNDRPKAELEAACAAYREAGAAVEFRALVLPPLWSRVDVTVAPELDSAVTEWLAARFPA